jgi:hypothetical protein
MTCAFSEHGGWLAARADLDDRAPEFPQQQERLRPVKRGDRSVMQDDVDTVAEPLALSR